MKNILLASLEIKQSIEAISEEYILFMVTKTPCYAGVLKSF